MSSEDNFTPRPDAGASGGPPHVSASLPPTGLPPVAPPSGKLMLQLFLVPGLIVAFLVVAWLIGGWLFGVSYSKDQFLARLKDSNPEVRWRTAEQLAQVLLRDDALAADGDFACQLGVMLEKTHDDARPAEKDYIQFLDGLLQSEPDDAKFKEKAMAEEAKLEANRNFITFLGASLGDFMVPVGVPALDDLATQKDGLDPRGLALQRRQAVWALANLGENMTRFDKLSDAEKESVLDRLRIALWDAAGGAGKREDFLKLSADEKDAALDRLPAPAQPRHADWLRNALHILRQRAKGVYDDTGVGDVLIACSQNDDPYLRELSAFAMNFWRGGDAADARMDAALNVLILDRGDDRSADKSEGQKRLASLLEEKEANPTQAVSRDAGLQIRFNAAVALARRGNPKARLDVLGDMLDENYLHAHFVVHPADGGPDRPNEELAVQSMLSALKAVAELHRRQPDVDLSALKPAVAALAGNANVAVRTEAEKTQLALK